DVAIVTVESLPGDERCVGRQQEQSSPGDVGGMDLLAARRGGDRLPSKHLANQFKPTAVRGGMGQAVNAGGPRSADGPAPAESIAVDELLQGSLMGAVRASRPQRMGLV